MLAVYYQKIKKRLSKKAREKKRQYGRGRHKNLLEDGKQRLFEYITN